MTWTRCWKYEHKRKKLCLGSRLPAQRRCPRGGVLPHRRRRAGRHFAQYELVVVDDACTDDTVAQLRVWGKEQAAPLTILHMSTYHGLENAMNAGLDAAIGDYVYEFDSTELCYPAELIFKAYQTALNGSDIVSVCPRTVRAVSYTHLTLPTNSRV